MFLRVLIRRSDLAEEAWSSRCYLTLLHDSDLSAIYFSQHFWCAQVNSIFFEAKTTQSSSLYILNLIFFTCSRWLSYIWSFSNLSSSCYTSLLFFLKISNNTPVIFDCFFYLVLVREISFYWHIFFWVPFIFDKLQEDRKHSTFILSYWQYFNWFMIFIYIIILCFWRLTLKEGLIYAIDPNFFEQGDNPPYRPFWPHHRPSNGSIRWRCCTMIWS